jgi:FKBP-type peptidyl-prolyl cis-trans isomerase (trigger factor)
MRQVEAMALALALSLGTATHAATFSSQEDQAYKGDEQGMAAEQAAVAEGSKVTIAFTLTVPETRQTIPNNVSEYTPGKHEITPALEDALMGMKPGEHKQIEFTA